MVFVIIHTPWPISKGLDHSICMFMLACFILVLASLVLGFAIFDALSRRVVTSDAHEALFGCNHLGCIAMMPVASCIASPFSTSCNDMFVMVVCATRWLYMHLYTLAYMSVHESCLLVCRPCFNTMKLWTFDPNLHLSFADTTFCLLSYLFTFLLICLLSCFFACHVYPAYLLYASFICSLHLFLPLLVCWFLVFAFACLHMEGGCFELGHSLPSASIKGVDASLLR